MSRQSDFDKQLEKKIYNLSTRKEKIYSKVGDVDSDKVKSDFGQEALSIMRDIMSNAVQSTEEQLSEKITRIKQLKTFIKDAKLGKREERELLNLAEKIHKALTKDADLKRKLFIKSTSALSGLIARSGGLASAMFGDDELVNDLLDKTGAAGKFMADKAKERIKKHQEKRASMKQDAESLLDKSKRAPKSRPSKPSEPLTAPAGGISPTTFNDQSSYGSSPLAPDKSTSHLLDTISQDVKQILNILRSSDDGKEEARLDAIEEKAETTKQNKKTGDDKLKKEKKDDQHHNKLMSLLSSIGPLFSGISAMVGSLTGLPGAILGLTAAVSYLSNNLGHDVAENTQLGWNVKDEQEKFKNRLKNDFEDAQQKEGWLDNFWEFNDERDEKIKQVGGKKLEELKRKRDDSLKALKDRMKRDPQNWQKSLEYMGYKYDSKELESVAGDFTNVTELANNPNNPQMAAAKASQTKLELKRESTNDLIKAIDDSAITNEATRKTQEELKTSIDNLSKHLESNTNSLEEATKKEKDDSLWGKIKELLKEGVVFKEESPKPFSKRDMYGRSRWDSGEGIGGGDERNSSISSFTSSLMSSIRSMPNASSLAASSLRSGLNIKHGQDDGRSELGTYAFAKMLSNEISDGFKITAFTDPWHKGHRGVENKHNRGLAFDAVFTSDAKLRRAQKSAEGMIKDSGAGAVAQIHRNEAGSPGHHLHFAFDSKADAAQFFRYAFTRVKPSGSMNPEEETIVSPSTKNDHAKKSLGRSSRATRARQSETLDLGTIKFGPDPVGPSTMDNYTPPPFVVPIKSVNPEVYRERRNPQLSRIFDAVSRPTAPAGGSTSAPMTRADTGQSHSKGATFCRPGSLFGCLIGE